MNDNTIWAQQCNSSLRPPKKQNFVTILNITYFVPLFKYAEFMRMQVCCKVLSDCPLEESFNITLVSAEYRSRIGSVCDVTEHARRPASSDLTFTEHSEKLVQQRMCKHPYIFRLHIFIYSKAQTSNWRNKKRNTVMTGIGPQNSLYLMRNNDFLL